MDILKYLLLSFLLLFLSCSAKRNVVADSSHVSNDTVSIVKNDSLTIKEDGIKKTNEKEIKKENTLEIITDYDSQGNISRRIERYNFIESLTLKDEFDIVKKDWLYGFSTIITSDSNSETKNHQSEITKQDSRIIQGTEWFWILLFTLVVGILMFFYFKK